ncbi:hypothetical protein OSTOST_06601, partial [Ostertagia ostertagi]
MDLEATFEIRLLASLSILFPAIIGLGLHTLLAITLYRGWKTFREISFYVITVQLQWCDVCALLLDLYVAFPLSLTGDQYMGDSIALYYGPLFFEGIAFNGLFLLSFIMSLNRFLLFILPQVHNKLFTYWGTRIASLIFVELFNNFSSIFQSTSGILVLMFSYSMFIYFEPVPYSAVILFVCSNCAASKKNLI